MKITSTLYLLIWYNRRVVSFQKKLAPHLEVFTIVVPDPEAFTVGPFPHYLSCWALKPDKHSAVSLYSQLQHDFSSIYSHVCFFVHVCTSMPCHIAPSLLVLDSFIPIPPPHSRSFLSFPALSLSNSSLCFVLLLSPYLSHLPTLSLLSSFSPQKAPCTFLCTCVEGLGETCLTRDNQGWEQPATFPKSRFFASGTGIPDFPQGAPCQAELEGLGWWSASNEVLKSRV